MRQSPALALAGEKILPDSPGVYKWMESLFIWWRTCCVFILWEGGKLLWADLEEMHLSAAEIPLFLLPYIWRLLSKLSQNKQKGEILDVKLQDRMETRHIGSSAVVSKTVVISRAAGLPLVSFSVLYCWGSFYFAWLWFLLILNSEHEHQDEQLFRSQLLWEFFCLFVCFPIEKAVVLSFHCWHCSEVISRE